MGNLMRTRTIWTAPLLVLAAATFGGAATSAQAADLAPVYKAKAPPLVEPFNPWMIRVRALGVLPDGGNSVNVFGVPALSSPNSGLSISDQVIPELDISYFFTPNVAAE